MSRFTKGEAHAPWIATTIDALGRLHCGQSPPSSQVNTEGRGTVYISGPEQWDGHEIHQSKWTTHAARKAPENSIFITVKGSGVGTMFPGIAAAIGRDIYAFQPYEGINARFVYYALQFSIQDVIAKARGDIPGLSKSHILSHPVTVPGPNTQQKVASKLDEFFSRIEDGERALTNVRTLESLLVSQRKGSSLGGLSASLRLAILKAAFAGQLVPHDPSDEPPAIFLKRVRTRQAK